MERYIGTKIITADPAHYYEVTCGPTLIQPDNEEISSMGASIINQAGPGREGYRVIYEDGYTSWSPKDVFEAAYRKADGLPFGLALEAMKKGKGARLPQWKPDVIIRAQFPNEYSKMTAPYLYVESRFGRVPWKETMIELFSDSWEIVE